MRLHRASFWSGVVAATLILIARFPATHLAAETSVAYESPGSYHQPSTSTSSEVTLSYLGGALWGPTQAVTVAGNYAFAATTLGIEILDVSDHSTPTIISRLPTAHGDVVALAVTGNDLLFQDGGVFRIVDVSDPRSPVELGNCRVPRYQDNLFKDIAVVGDAVYLATYGGGVNVVSMADPTSPLLEMTMLPEKPRSITVSGNVLLVSAFDGLRSYSLASPHHPFLLGYYVFSCDASNDVVAQAGYAYVTQLPGGMHVIDISHPAFPGKAGVFVSGGGPLRCDIQENFLFMAMADAGLGIADLTDPIAPVLVGSLDAGGYVSRVAASGNYAYLVNEYAGLQIADVADPTHPTLVSTRPGAGYSGDVALDGELAYVANGGLSVLSIEDPQRPLPLGDLRLNSWSFAVAAQGSLAFVADNDIVPGVRIISVVDPTTPVAVGFYETYTDPNSLLAKGNFLYVADGNLRVVDVSDPTAPQSVAGLITPGEAMNVCLEGDFAYIADGEAGLQIANVADPSHPYLVGGIDSPGLATGVCVAGTRAYLADGTFGLQVVDVSDPQSPTLLGSHDTPGFARRVKVSGDYAIVADQKGGVLVINVSNPATPFLYTATTYRERITPQNLIVDGDHLIVAGGGELTILSLAVNASSYLVGDANADSTITSADVIYLVNFVFKGGPQPLINYRSGDIDCNGPINSADLIRLVNFVFKGGAAPGCP